MSISVYGNCEYSNTQVQSFQGCGQHLTNCHHWSDTTKAKSFVVYSWMLASFLHSILIQFYYKSLESSPQSVSFDPGSIGFCPCTPGFLIGTTSMLRLSLARGQLLTPASSCWFLSLPFHLPICKVLRPRSNLTISTRGRSLLSHLIQNVANGLSYMSTTEC